MSEFRPDIDDQMIIDDTNTNINSYDGTDSRNVGIDEENMHVDISSSIVTPNKDASKDASNDDNNDNNDAGSSTGNSHGNGNLIGSVPTIDIAKLEEKARGELRTFLESKKIDPIHADRFGIHVQVVKKSLKSLSASSSASSPSKEKKDEVRFTTTYTSPDGSILLSKHDVCSAIAQFSIKKKPRPSAGGIVDIFGSGANSIESLTRHNVSEAARQRLIEAQASLPFVCDGMTVLSFGEFQDHPSLVTPVQVYPMGYKVEFPELPDVSSKSSSSSSTPDKRNILRCEVSSIDGHPEFSVLNVKTGVVHVAFSESSLWKKFDPLSGNRGIYSFFNLSIELMLEGLNGVVDNDTYKFHFERGYGTTYTTNEQSMVAKANYSAKSGRAQRNQQRQQTKFMSPEDVRKNQELQRLKQEEEENERKQLLQAAEKDRKLKSKEEKRSREEAERQKREIERQKRENQKMLEAMTKERRKDEEKVSKERQKAEEKVKQVHRKDVAAEIRKQRNECQSMIIQAFDREEDLEEKLSAVAVASTTSPILFGSPVSGKHGFPSSGDSFGMFWDSLPSCADAFQTVEGNLVGDNNAIQFPDLAVNWDNMFNVANTLYVFRDYLSLSKALTLDEIIQALRVYSMPTVAEPLQSALPLNFDAVETKATEQEVMDTDAVAENVTTGESMDNPPQAEPIIDTTRLRAEEQWSQATIVLDRIQLRLTQSISSATHALLDLNEMEIPVENGRKDSRSKHTETSAAVRLPLNQLTWPEIARMGIVASIYTELGRTRDDTQTAIRGGRLSQFRNTKNIIRNIRYKWFVRAKRAQRETALTVNEPRNLNSQSRSGLSLHDDRLQVMLESRECNSLAAKSAMDVVEEVPSSAQDFAAGSTARRQAPGMQNMFSTDAELINSVEELLHDESTPEVYLRCAKLFLLVVRQSAAKNFMWEVDTDVVPEYYSVVDRPMMLCNVATNLVTRAYGDVDEVSFNAVSTSIDATGSIGDSIIRNPAGNQMSPASMSIAAEFYSDMRQVFLNCITYYPENVSFVPQAHKLLHVFSRHAQRWLFARDRLPVLSCDQYHCLLSGILLASEEAQTASSVTVQCGRCAGYFMWHALEKERDSIPPTLYTDAVLLPNTEQMEQLSEEWLCPLCLVDDSISIPEATHPAFSSHAFYVDEWGPSCILPWSLNSMQSTLAKRSLQDSPMLNSLFKAISVLSDPRFEFLPALSFQDHQSHSAVEADDYAQAKAFLQRMELIVGLCETMKSCKESHAVLEAIYAECQKLSRISEKQSFREADFMDTVRAIAGDAGVRLCRCMLDGIENGEDSSVLHSKLTDGRCVICLRSTFEEDLEEGEGLADIILCDGCNGEAHLRCTSLQSVTSEDWHCPTCADRHLARHVAVSHRFDNIDSFRNRELEDELLEKAISLKAGLKVDNAMPAFECAYCGLRELDICSPMVCGQTRGEHDAFISLNRAKTVDDFLPGRRGTGVSFVVNGAYVPQPVLDMPYFPLVSSKHSLALVTMARKLPKSVFADDHSLFVHELCALQMFRARMDKSRHTLRRRRRIVAETAISMSGISSRCIGKDDRNIEYWKFPCSDDLYLCYGATSRPLEEDEAELRRIIGEDYIESKSSQSNSSSSAIIAQVSHGHVWKRVSNRNDVRRIVELLGASKKEDELRWQLITTFLLDKTSASANQISAESVESDKPPCDTEEHEAKDAAQVEKDNDEVECNSESVPTRQVPKRQVAPPQVNVEAPSAEELKIPTTLKLLTDKGVNIAESYVIAQENVFEDVDPSCGAEGFTHRDFFSFGKKYYAIALLNVLDKRVRPAANTFRVIYQIHVEGRQQALAYTPLSEAWSDGLFYFSTISFKRSGVYTVSFLVENIGFNGTVRIKPLVFKVVVEAKKLVSGPLAAQGLLRAKSFSSAGNRQFLVGHELRQFVDKLPLNDFSCVKGAIVTLFMALPMGSVQVDPSVASLNEVALDGSTSSAQLWQELTIHGLADAVGWNDILHQYWIANVRAATTPAALMECLLVLEYYINKNWLMSPSSRLLNALPQPHAAMRCCTVASVALRVYCLDNCLNYTKVELPSRERRQPASTYRAEVKPTVPAVTSRKPTQNIVISNRPSTRHIVESDEEVPVQESEEESGEKENLDDDPHYSTSRTRRKAARVASNRLKRQQRQSSESAFSDKVVSNSRNSSNKRKRGQRDSDDEEEFDDEESSHSEAEDESDDEADQDDYSSKRKSRRQSTKVKSYVDNGSSSEEEEEDQDQDDDDDEDEDDKDLYLRKRRNTRPSPPKKRLEEDDEEGLDEEESFDDAGPDAAAIERGATMDFTAEIASVLAQAGSSALCADDDLKIRFYSVLRALKADPKTGIFWVPVDTKLVRDYTRYIKEPMDLGTIALRVKADFFGTDHVQFIKSIRLVWSNCTKYNHQSTWLHQEARRLAAYCEGLYSSWIVSEYRPTNPDQRPS